jgi:autotransporter passenger strand-loop-strand repeat protein
MATIFNSAGGNWTATSTWLGGMVPTAADDVVLDFFNPAQPNQSHQVDLGVAAAGHGLTILDSDVLNLSSSALLSLNVLVIGRGGQLTGSATVQAADTVHNNGAIETISSAGLVFGGGAAELVNTGTLQTSEVGQIRISMGINNPGIVRSEGSGMISLSNTNNSGLISAEGSASIQANGAIFNSGKIEADHGRIVLLGDTANVHGGQLVATNGGFLFEAGAVTGGLGIISGNSTLYFQGSAFEYSTTSVSFQGPGSLNLDNSARYTGTIQGFGAGDKINILDVGYVPGRDSYNPQSGLLTVGDGTHTTELQLLGTFAASSFTFRAGADGGTSVTYNLLGTPAPPAVGDPAFQIVSLYVGYFGRAGDPAGMMYWQDQLIAGHGSPDALAAIAVSFSAQAEAVSGHPMLADPQHATQAQVTSFIASVYENLFDRAPDAAGAAYWQQELTAHLGDPQAVGSFILSVIGGAQAQDAATLANKVEAAKFFSDQLGIEHLPFDAAAAAIAHTAIDGVTSDPSTVTAAELVVSAFIDTPPPTGSGQVLNSGDTLNVSGHITDTTINDGGVANVLAGGQSNYTNINAGGVENILSGGLSHGTTVANGGVENVYGRSIETEIDLGGVENIYSGGTSVRPHVDGGVVHVFSGGKAQDVIFDGPNSTLELATPSALTGAIVHWRVGDVIDLLNIRLTDLHQSAGDLTVTFEGGSATYAVVDQQAGTFAHAVSDGHGGTNLVLTQIVNAIGAGSNQVSSAGLGDASAQLVGVAHNFDHAGIV